VPYVPEQFKPFEGKIIHSSSWDNDFDLTDKTVAVIGSGTRYAFSIICRSLLSFFLTLVQFKSSLI
jgi:lysine/ornithine N-monooxygenase